ncbi:MAG: hypothetical protein IK089_02170, partial [Oxalobacter sp.]|nr:hypothetical protein [Oxalobacter sp.]
TQSKFTLSGGTSDDPNTLGTATIAKAQSSLDVISGTSSATNMIGNGIVNVGRAASTDPAVEASHATLSITAADNGTGTGLAALNVNTSGSTANVKAADNKAYTIASLSNEGAVNTVGNIQASGISGTNGQINIGSTDKTSTFSVTGGNVITPNTLGVDTVASGSQLKITSGVSSATKITNNGTVLVGTNDSAATLRVGQLSGNGILFVDPAWSDNDADNTPANASNLAVGSWDADSDLLIGRNTIGILGSTDENKAVAAVTWLNANTPLAWGNPDKGTNYFGTALAVVDSQAVDSDSSLIVDSRLDAISDSLSDYKDKVTVASQSLLYVGSADNLTTPSNVVLAAGTINNSGTLLNQGFLQANAINNNGDLFTSRIDGLNTPEINLNGGALNTIANSNDGLVIGHQGDAPLVVNMNGGEVTTYKTAADFLKGIKGDDTAVTVDNLKIGTSTTDDVKLKAIVNVNASGYQQDVVEVAELGQLNIAKTADGAMTVSNLYGAGDVNVGNSTGSYKGTLEVTAGKGTLATLNVNTADSTVDLTADAGEDYTIGTLTNAGTAKVKGGTVTLENLSGADGDLTVASGATATVKGADSKSRNITGEGTVNVGDGSDTAKLTVSAGNGSLTSLDVKSNATADITADSSYTIGTLANAGTANVAGGTVTLNSLSGADGDLTVASGATATVKGTDSKSKNITGEGTVNVGDGSGTAKLTVSAGNGSLTNLDVKANGMADITAESAGYTIETLTNAGTVKISDGNVAITDLVNDDLTQVAKGQLTVATVGGTVGTSGNMTVGDGTNTNALLSYDAELILLEGTVNGDMTILSDGKATLTEAGKTLLIKGDMTNNGILVEGGGNIIFGENDVFTNNGVFE